MPLWEIISSEDALARALSGALADACQVLILFPMETVKVKLQADPTFRIRELFELAVKKRDPLILYRGVFPKLVQSSQGKFQYFYTNFFLSAVYAEYVVGKRKFSATEALVIGYFSALQGLGTSIPLIAVTNRMIAESKKQGAKPQSYAQVFHSVFVKEGVMSMYRASFVASALLCINPAITYVLFDLLKAKLVMNRAVDQLGTLEAFVIAAIAKAVATVVTFPLTRSKVMMTTWDLQVKLAKEEHGVALPKENTSLLFTLKHIMSTEGFIGLYRGLPVQLTKGVLNAAIMLALKEKIYSQVSEMMSIKRK